MKNVILFAALLFLLAFPSGASAQVDAQFSGGAVRVGPAAATTCNAAAEGALRWNGTTYVHEQCDGTQWRGMVYGASTVGASFSTPDTNIGYFVMTNGKWDGNLGGVSGANDKCYTDLTTYDWLGKADASARGLLTRESIRPFLCLSYGCHNAIAYTTYKFAVSNDTSAGGASFRTTGTGQGPNNTIGWSGTNYFNGKKQYWLGRSNDTSSLWSLMGGGSDTANRCNFFSSNSSAHTSSYGDSHVSRWANSDLYPCDKTMRMICMVHP